MIFVFIMICAIGFFAIVGMKDDDDFIDEALELTELEKRIRKGNQE